MAYKFNKNKLYIVEWQDAAFSKRKKLPRLLPYPQLTIGYLSKITKKFIKLTCNFRKINDKLSPLDGFLIPKKTILKMRRIK